MNKFTWILVICMSILSFTTVSCSDDDSSNNGDNGDKLLIAKEYMDNGWSYTYEYDSQNRIVKLTEIDPGDTEAEGDYIQPEVFKYDDDGRLISISEKSYRSNTPDVIEYNVEITFTYKGDSIFLSENNGDLEVYIVNTKNQLVKRLFNPGNISPNSPLSDYNIATYEYDASGRLIKEIREYRTDTYEYDDKNGLLKNVNILPWQSLLIGRLELIVSNPTKVISGDDYNITYQYTYNEQNFITKAEYTSTYFNEIEEDTIYFEYTQAQ